VIDCVVPAAGEGSRFTGEGRRFGGEPDAGATVKVVALFERRPLLLHVIERVLAVCDRCIVVTGAHREAVERVVEAARRSLQPGSRRNLLTVHNPDWREGMISSIAAGAARVRTPWFFVAPADMPRLPVEVFRTLLSHADIHGGREPDDAALIRSIAPRYREQPGHPVLVSAALREELLAEYRRFRSMREFLQRYPREEIPVDDPGTVFDVDLPGDLAQEARVHDNSE